MSESEYLLGYGILGDFGRFRSVRPLICRRGDWAVVHSARGLEFARVLREAMPGHARFLPNTSVGKLLRLATPEDEEQAKRMALRSRQIFERGQGLVGEFGLTLELLDVEVLLDGEHAVLHLLREAVEDVRPFVSTLSREFGMHVLLQDLTGPAGKLQEEDEGLGCGREGCGGGHCGRCDSGGCGTCGTAKAPEGANPFADLREQMERRRMALL
jgi:hypothetical protein